MRDVIENRPLITFMILGYNQEQYIGEAVAGAFSQTYSPLEIILSDDCSPDRTFEIMEEMAGRYRGEHRIRLNGNEVNRGLGGHIDRLMELARGELIVVAAGDDISLPERVERTWEAYVDSGGKAMSVYSSLLVIDEKGERKETVGKPPHEAGHDIEAYLAAATVHGCSHAWHRQVFDVFGAMLPGTVCEDRVIPFRSVMLGEIRYIDEPLVLYRRHSQSITGPQTGSASYADVVAHVVKRQRRRLLTLKNYERDLRRQHESIRIPTDVRNRLSERLCRQIRQLELEIQFHEGAFRDRIRVIGRGISGRLGVPRIAKWGIQLVYPYHLIRARKKLLADCASEGR